MYGRRPYARSPYGSLTIVSVGGGTTTPKTLVATCTSSASVTAIKAKLLTLVATCTSTSLVFGAMRYARVLAATCTTTSTALAHKCIVYTKSLLSTCTTSSFVNVVKSLAGSIASLAAQLRTYKPQSAPVIPGNDVKYLLVELQKISDAFNAHVQVTKNLDARLKSAGF